MYCEGWLALLLVSFLTCFSCSDAIHIVESGAAVSSIHAPRVGLCLTVHRPKFPYVARFLEQYGNCPAARKAMDVVVVFSDQKDFNLFKEGLPLFNRTIPIDAWTPLIANVPEHFDYLRQAPYIAAWKKFFGMAYMMDLEDPPDYGVMADSELLLYDENDCGKHSKWNMLLERIQAREKKQEWNAVRINEEDKFAFQSIKTIMRNNREFLTGKYKDAPCTLPNCDHLVDYQMNVTFSWWTDLPWVNFTVLGNMFSHIADRKKESSEKWTEFVYPLNFCRYEHTAYQYWTVLNENFKFRNVTHITGATRGMATYTEGENRNGSRIAKLFPLWVSDRTREQTHGPLIDREDRHFSQIEPFSAKSPPLLLFHCDLAGKRMKEKNTEWEHRVNLSRANLKQA